MSFQVTVFCFRSLPKKHSRPKANSTSEKVEFFHLRALTATMKLHKVPNELQRSSAVFWNLSDMSHENSSVLTGEPKTSKFRKTFSDNHRAPLDPYSTNWDKWNQNFPGFTFLLIYCMGDEKKNQNFVDFHALNATTMVRLVLPCSFATSWKKIKIFKMSHEIPYFGRGRKMLYEKVSKNKNRVTL